MTRIERLYGRADDWARSLPRGRYALLVGTVATLSYLLVGTLFGGSVTVEAVTMGVTLGVLFYVFDPNGEA